MLNTHYNRLTANYLFAEVGRKNREYRTAHPDKKVISLGIGDVTRPLPEAVITAIKAAADDMASAATFKGYSPDQGYDFLRDGIIGYYAETGVAIDKKELFVSDGAKSDVGNITELFSADAIALIPDPVYPVYVDANIMAGRNVKFISANAGNGFLPAPPRDMHADIIYICSPNNPTGATYTMAGLQAWVDYANAHSAVIIYDAAYEAFVSDPELPRSIYQIPGARTCAIEMCSLSKTAGFTGMRCGYTVVPAELERDGMSVNHMWARRQGTKFNGVSYVTQRAAAAIYTAEGRAQIKANLDYYRQNATVLAAVLEKKGIYYTGGHHSPYLWLRCPGDMRSWDFFDRLLNEVQIVGTPGSGFGTQGEGYFRLTAFGEHEAVNEAAERLMGWL